MLRRLWSCLVAASFVMASSSGAIAETWKQTYYMQTNTLQGVLEEDELLTMAYLKVPFGGRLSKPNKAVWGLSLNSRLPYEYGHMQFGNHAGVATLMDLRFDGRKVQIETFETRVADRIAKGQELAPKHRKAILEHWRFPEEIIVAVDDHESLDRVHRGPPDLTDIVCVANLLAQGDDTMNAAVDLDAVPAVNYLRQHGVEALDTLLACRSEIAALEDSLR